MTGDRSFRLTLVPTDDGRGITGRLRDEHGEEQRFSSWLGLLSLLQTGRVRTPSGPPDPERRVARAEEA